MHILSWLAEDRPLVSFHLLAKARQVQSVVYPMKTTMCTYKRVYHFFLYFFYLLYLLCLLYFLCLLYLSTPRPPGTTGKTARVVVRIHNQVVVGGLHRPLPNNEIQDGLINKDLIMDHQSQDIVVKTS